MDIFEQLENLNVSEECFDEIMDIVETLIGNFTVPASDEFGKSYLKGKYSEEATPKEKRKALASDELLRRNATEDDPKVKKSIKRHKKSLAESIEILEAILNETSYEKANTAFDKRFIPIGKAQENLTKAFNKAHEEGNKEKSDKIIKASEKINDFMGKKLDLYDKWNKAKKKNK